MPAALFRGRLSGPRGLALLTSGIALHVRLSQASCRIARTVAAQQPPQPSRGLTIRPSRRRFTATNFSCMFLLYCGRAAARLNSGVRPLMNTCRSCDYWSSPRGFQRPGDYYWVQLKLLEWIEQGKLAIVSSEGFPANDATPHSRPAQSLSALFECTDCRRKLDLVLDIDACRGGLFAA